MGHIRKSDTFYKGGGVFHTDSEIADFERAIIRFNPRQAEESETVQEVAPAPQAQQQGVTRDEILGALAAVVEAVRNLPAPQVRVEVNPELKMGDTVQRTTITRDDRNQMTGSVTEVSAKPKD